MPSNELQLLLCHAERLQPCVTSACLLQETIVRESRRAEHRLMFRARFVVRLPSARHS